MILYIIVILLAWAGMFLVNHFVFMPVLDFAVWFNIVAIIGSTIVVIIIDGLCAAVAHALQKKHFSPLSPYFTVSPKEQKRLEALGIKRIKHLIPDLGVLVKFAKNKVENPRSKQYIYMYLKESCSGEAGHTVSMFLGFLVIFILPLQYIFCFGLPVAIFNFILNLLPVLSLRYNRPRMMNIYRILERKEAKENANKPITESAAN